MRTYNVTMRKYVLPTVIFSAIAAIIVVLVRMSDDSKPTEVPPPKEQPEAVPEPTEDWKTQTRKTRIGLDTHKWMSELERSMGREDLSNARYYRTQVCSQIDRNPGLIQ